MLKNPMVDGKQTGLRDENPATIAYATLKLWQRTQKSHWFPVQGISMWPFLRRGDKVLVSPEPAPLEAGNVVVIRLSGRMLVHRLVKINGQNEVITWGDFNLHPDPVAKRSQIVGKVLAVEREQRRFALGRVHQLWTWCALWGRPALIAAVFGIRCLIRVRNRLQTLAAK